MDRFTAMLNRCKYGIQSTFSERNINGCQPLCQLAFRVAEPAANAFHDAGFGDERFSSFEQIEA
jgi:hypothetical protein